MGRRHELIERRAHGVRYGRCYCLRATKMLLREDERGWIAIGQPSARVDLGPARSRVGKLIASATSTRSTRCVSRPTHDIGWAERDSRP